MFTKVPPKGPTVKGFDISHHNAVTIDQLAKDMAFCFHKATEGDDYVDPMFKKRWPLIEKAGLVRGCYHYFRPSHDPIKQAKHFADVVGPMLKLNDMVMMDWEATDGISAKVDVELGYKFLKEVERLLLKKPILYSYPYFLQDLHLDMRFGEYPLWISDPTSIPRITGPWPAWTFWQHNFNGFDHDVFNGTLDDLKAFCVPSMKLN